MGKPTPVIHAQEIVAITERTFADIKRRLEAYVDFEKCDGEEASYIVRAMMMGLIDRCDTLKSPTLKMMTIYHYDEQEVLLDSSDFPAPSHMPERGDIYRILHGFTTLDGFTTLGGEEYKRGDTLEIVKRTMDIPHGRITSEGNLMVLGRNEKVTVWSNIELMIRQGYLQRVIPTR